MDQINAAKSNAIMKNIIDVYCKQYRSIVDVIAISTFDGTNVDKVVTVLKEKVLPSLQLQEMVPDPFLDLEVMVKNAKSEKPTLTWKEFKVREGVA